MANPAAAQGATDGRPADGSGAADLGPQPDLTAASGATRADSNGELTEIPAVRSLLAGDLTAFVLTDVCTSVNQTFAPPVLLGSSLYRCSAPCRLHPSAPFTSFPQHQHASL